MWEAAQDAQMDTHMTCTVAQAPSASMLHVQAMALHLFNRLRRWRLDFGPLTRRLPVLGGPVVHLCRRHAAGRQPQLAKQAATASHRHKMRRKWRCCRKVWFPGCETLTRRRVVFQKPSCSPLTAQSAGAARGPTQIARQSTAGIC